MKDAKSILDAFREAGIQPGKELEEAVSSAGFDMDELFSLAGPPEDESGSTGTSASGTDIASFLQQLQSILSQYDLTNLSNDQQNQLFYPYR